MEKIEVNGITNKYDAKSTVIVEGIKYKVVSIDWCDLMEEFEYWCESLHYEYIDEYMLESEITMGTL